MYSNFNTIHSVAVYFRFMLQPKIHFHSLVHN